MKPELQTLATKLRKALSDGANFPLVYAADVLKAKETWDDELDLDTWLKVHVHPQRGLAWWQRRVDCVNALGECVRRKMDYTAAYWVYNSIEPEYWDPVIATVMEATVSAGGALLSCAQVYAIAKEIVPGRMKTETEKDRIIRELREENRLLREENESLKLLRAS